MSKKNKKSKVYNSLYNCNVQVDGSRSKIDQESLKNLTEALLNVSKLLLNEESRPVYGIYMGSEGILPIKKDNCDE
jgi:hypothetical protein